MTSWSTRKRRTAGMGYIPEDRHRHGLMLEAPLWENRILGHQTEKPNARGPIDRRRGRQEGHRTDCRPTTTSALPASASRRRRCPVATSRSSSSAREMSSNPTVLIAAHPTRGVDVGAQAAIWEHLRTARANGLAVLLISADLDELIGMSDMLHVILRGRLVGDGRPEDGDAGRARRGDDRRGHGPPDRRRASVSDRLYRLALGLVAALVALAFAAGVTSIVLELTNHNPATALKNMVDYGTKPDQLAGDRQPGHHLLPLRGRGGDRVPDEPVQHRGRRPVPARRADRRRLRWRGGPAERAASVRDHPRRDARGLVLGRHRGRPARYPRRERGHLERSCST